MNKLSRERVKNNFKWIYVQPTSSRLKIDGLGAVINCILFSSPHPVSEKTDCQTARKEKAFHFALVDTTLPEPALFHLFDRLGTLVSMWPGAGEVTIRGCQEMCVCRFCLTFPGSFLSVLQSPNVCAMKIYAGDALFSPATQAHSLEHGDSGSQLIFWRSPEETEKVLPTPLPDSTTMNIKFNETRKKEKKVKI